MHIWGMENLNTTLQPRNLTSTSRESDANLWRWLNGVSRTWAPLPCHEEVKLCWLAKCHCRNVQCYPSGSNAEMSHRHAICALTLSLSIAPARWDLPPKKECRMMVVMLVLMLMMMMMRRRRINHLLWTGLLSAAKPEAQRLQCVHK